MLLRWHLLVCSCKMAIVLKDQEIQCLISVFIVSIEVFVIADLQGLFTYISRLDFLQLLLREVKCAHVWFSCVVCVVCCLC